MAGRSVILRRINNNGSFEDFLDTCRSNDGPDFIVDQAVGMINRIKEYVKPLDDRWRPTAYPTFVDY
jgi:hypothetical protein